MRHLVLILLASGAVADTTATPDWPDCFCTDKNRTRYELGDRVCLTVDGRSFIAECQMSQNVPMWRELDRLACPLAQTLPSSPFMTRMMALTVLPHQTNQGPSFY